MNVSVGPSRKLSTKELILWAMVLEKTLESPLDYKEIKPVSPKGNQPWIFIGRTDAKVEAPILWPPDAKSQLIGKDPDAGKDWGHEEKGMTEDEMFGWHHGQWTRIWANSRRQWRTGKPDVLQSMELQRIRLSNWITTINYSSTSPWKESFDFKGHAPLLCRCQPA